MTLQTNGTTVLHFETTTIPLEVVYSSAPVYTSSKYNHTFTTRDIHYLMKQLSAPTLDIYTDLPWDQNRIRLGASVGGQSLALEVKNLFGYFCKKEDIIVWLRDLLGVWDDL